KKTLHPDPSKRFRTIKEFKEFITNFFHIEELSSITFNLAYFMNSLTSEFQLKEEQAISEEKKFVLPEPKKPAPVPAPRNDEKLVENLLSGLDERKKTPWPLIGGAAAAVLVVALVLFFYFGGQRKKAEQQALKAQADLTQKLLTANEAKYEQKMKELEATFQQKQAATEEERKAIDAKQKEMLAAIQKQKTDEENRIKAAQALDAAKKKDESDRLARELAQKQQEEQDRLAREAEAKKQEALAAQKKIEDAKAKEGDLVGLSDVSSKPEKISGNVPVISPILQKKYRGTVVTLRPQLLVDENGNVIKVNVAGAFGADIKELLVDTLLKWKFKPAVKDNVRVKVWWMSPAPFQFKF
ncbi:MAG TPA: hypothetical protein PKK12_13510, partial [Candidatus Aminicenantes bacterium]|nr:hypothetical protein [Candidatus Aminicenantes bacterium]